jgi:hypothetical protein
VLGVRDPELARRTVEHPVDAAEEVRLESWVRAVVR